MQDKIRWGIIGTGGIAHKFAQGLAVLDDAQLVAVGSRSQEAADKFGNEFQVPRRHATYDALARDPDVDVVYIATPHPFHRENTLTCIEQGKAVLCEKPFAMNSGEALDMAAMAIRHKVFLMEAMWTHFFPAVLRILELIEQGAIGDIRLMRADFCFRAELNPASRLFDLRLGGGGLLDIGVYTIAFAQMVFRQEPTRLTGLAHFGETGVDEQASMVLGYDKGALATLTCSVRANAPHEAVIYGTEGSIRILPLFWQPTKFVLSRGGKDEESSFERIGNGYNYEAAEVGRCLREGKLQSDILPLSKTLAVMRTLDRLRAQWGFRYPSET